MRRENPTALQMRLETSVLPDRLVPESSDLSGNGAPRTGRRFRITGFHILLEFGSGDVVRAPSFCGLIDL